MGTVVHTVADMVVDIDTGIASGSGTDSDFVAGFDSDSDSEYHTVDSGYSNIVDRPVAAVVVVVAIAAVVVVVVVVVVVFGVVVDPATPESHVVPSWSTKSSRFNATNN